VTWLHTKTKILQFSLNLLTLVRNWILKPELYQCAWYYWISWTRICQKVTVSQPVYNVRLTW